MSHKVFWLEPTNQYQHAMRRYAGGKACAARPYGMSIHDARVDLQRLEAIEHPSGYDPGDDDDPADTWKSDPIRRDDPRWPSRCACGYEFTADDSWQVNFDGLYEAHGGARDGELWTLRDAPVGAMWDASLYRSDGETEGPWIGPDGLCLVVKTPGGDWLVDSEASNCTRTQWTPADGGGKRWTGRTHYCWIRHGDPRKPETLHVDKNGNTCSAGAGSIQAGSYHGFLHHGELT